jgi:Transposase DDE domain group 1
MLSLRPGNVHAALGADDDLAYLVTRLRLAWPDVVLHFRGDCGFGVPAMDDVCEGLRVSYTFGLSANAVLQRQTEGLLAEAVAAHDPERQAEQGDAPDVAPLRRLPTATPGRAAGAVPAAVPREPGRRPGPRRRPARCP